MTTTLAVPCLASICGFGIVTSDPTSGFAEFRALLAGCLIFVPNQVAEHRIDRKALLTVHGADWPRM